MAMLEHLGMPPFITAPAIWGKLPSHVDLVRSGMRPGESEAWDDWLAMQGAVVRAGGPVLSTAALPTTFVLPPGSLSVAIQHFVVGVIVPSMDRVGHRHVLLVYQLAGPRWVNRHFALHARQPCDWLFWLGRALSRHSTLADAADVWALARAVDELWQVHTSVGRGPRLPWRRGRAPLPVPGRVQKLLARWVGLQAMNDPAARMMGVRHLPWTDWPQCLRNQPADAPAAFWQQDANGGFVNAARQLDILWSEAP